MPVSETFDTVATPEALVVAVPTLLPLSVKATLLPLRRLLLLSARVADRLTVPPKVPVDGSVIRLVCIGCCTGHAPGPGVRFRKPETVPLNTEDVVVPVVLTTTTKLWPAGTVNE